MNVIFLFGQKNSRLKKRPAINKEGLRVILNQIQNAPNLYS